MLPAVRRALFVVDPIARRLHDIPGKRGIAPNIVAPRVRGACDHEWF